MQEVPLPTIAMLALALVGCSGESQSPTPSGTAETEAFSVAPEATLSSAPPPALEPSEGPIVREIPLALRGRWGLVPADCTSTRGDAKGLLIIGTTDMRFYESVGTLVTATSPDPARLRGTFAFTGEGMEWSRDVSLHASSGGGSLDFSDTGSDSPPSRRTYTRCG